MVYGDDGRPHPLLSQIPLTVNRFISLPTPPTLPYTYKPLPSTLPASSTSATLHIPGQGGAGATAEEIISRCKELKDYVAKAQEDAERALREWECAVREEELAEKRRLAPGWLDRNERVLEPKRAGGTDGEGRGEVEDRVAEEKEKGGAASPGNELDRAFGARLAFRPK